MLVSVFEEVDDGYDPCDGEMIVECPECGTASLIVANNWPHWDGTVVCEMCCISYKLELRRKDEQG